MANFFQMLGQHKKALPVINKGLKTINEKIDFYILIYKKDEILFNLGNYADKFKNFTMILNIDKDDIRVKHF